jgi:hypothetical protein
MRCKADIGEMIIVACSSRWRSIAVGRWLRRARPREIEEFHWQNTGSVGLREYGFCHQTLMRSMRAHPSRHFEARPRKYQRRPAIILRLGCVAHCAARGALKPSRPIFPDHGAGRTGDRSRPRRLGKRHPWLVQGRQAQSLTNSLSIKFREVSNIDQPLRNSEAHASSITAPPSAIIGDRECCTLPPNAGKCHATSLFLPQPITHAHRAPALFALYIAHDAGAHQSGSNRP